MRIARFVWTSVFLLAGLVRPVGVRATVFLNEVVVNPPGSLDDFREYIELQGVPGRKLDGYAIAFLNGSEQKYYTRNSIPPLPDPKPEIDEFFSLDGLHLGANGLLVIAIANIGSYPEVLSDSQFLGPWSDLWNGGLDIANRLSNDGSNTVILMRRRPGQTEADPFNAGGLRWAKSLYHDFELIRSVLDPQDGMLKDQWGDGGMDRGQSNGLSGFTPDVLGASTFTDLDDLEIVDEVSYESERGWEYDTDDRHVDIGSTVPGLPERHVHALDDPQGFNPDSLTRVDYRVSGSGWVPAAGGVGELAGGRNWQDTATEQWIRGETVVLFEAEGPRVFYSNLPNVNPDSIQPYETNVPLWLADGTPPDYDFSMDNTYESFAGRINQFAIPFIPGDVDRDGDCDAADIAKLTAVFGNDDWIFSNAFAGSTQGNVGDPSLQTRPWDVDLTGDNGIEASDLQWVLNFQGNTNGRVIGVRYDSTNPSSTGVILNPAAGVGCTMTSSLELPCGRPIFDLRVGDQIDFVVTGRVSAGARTNPSEANGIMQFVHDVTISTGGVLRALDATPAGGFQTPRPGLHLPMGAGGDLGLATITGFTTSFTQGVSGAVPLYRVRLQAIGVGTAVVTPRAAVQDKFMLSTPRGLKVGHTDQQGNPNNATYPAGTTIVIHPGPQATGDCEGDDEIQEADHTCFVGCLGGPGAVDGLIRSPFDLDEDGDVDLADFDEFMRRFGQ